MLVEKKTSKTDLEPLPSRGVQHRAQTDGRQQNPETRGTIIINFQTLALGVPFALSGTRTRTHTFLGERSTDRCDGRTNPGNDPHRIKEDQRFSYLGRDIRNFPHDPLELGRLLRLFLVVEGDFLAEFPRIGHCC